MDGRRVVCLTAVALVFHACTWRVALQENNHFPGHCRLCLQLMSLQSSSSLLLLFAARCLGLYIHRTASVMQWTSTRLLCKLVMHISVWRLSRSRFMRHVHQVVVCAYADNFKDCVVIRPTVYSSTIRHHYYAADLIGHIMSLARPSVPLRFPNSRKRKGV